MFKRTAATAVAITFALALPADALGLGGGLGGRGKGKSSSSAGNSSKKSGGISAGASVGRGGISAGARAGGIGVGASVGRSGASVSSSVGDAASVGASISRSGVSTSTSVGGVSVDTSVSRTGVSARAAVDGPGAPSPDTQPQSLAAIPAAGTAALLLLPLPAPLQPEAAEGRSCVRDACHSGQLQEGRASIQDTNVRTGSLNAGSFRSGADLPQKPGTPSSIVSACQLAATRAASAYGAVSVEAASGGAFNATGSGGGVAPVNLRVNYPGSTGSRQARVSCAINSDGVVTGLAV